MWRLVAPAAGVGRRPRSPRKEAKKKEGDNAIVDAVIWGRPVPAAAGGYFIDSRI
jgi:hypothetical protein